MGKSKSFNNPLLNTFKHVFVAMFGYMSAYMVIGLYSALFVGTGYYIIQQYNKPNTKLPSTIGFAANKTNVIMRNKLYRSVEDFWHQEIAPSIENKFLLHKHQRILPVHTSLIRLKKIQ